MSMELDGYGSINPRSLTAGFAIWYVLSAPTSHCCCLLSRGLHSKIAGVLAMYMSKIMKIWCLNEQINNLHEHIKMRRTYNEITPYIELTI
ncbi:unnamed protein product, partial [Brenthis ino]